MCRGHTGTPCCEVFQDKWRTCWHLQSLVHELEATAKNGVFPSIFHRFRLILLVWQVRFSLRTKKKGENFKNRRKNYLSWVFTRPALHSLTLLYSQWNAYVHDCLFFHRLPNSLEISHFSLRMLLNISRSLWHSSAKNVDKWKPLDYQTVWKRFRHYISKILDSIPQGNKVKCFFFIYYDLLQQNVRSHLLTTGYFLFNNPLAFKALLHACGTS